MKALARFLPFISFISSIIFSILSAFVILAAFALTSCATGGHLPVPGEAAVVKQKISSEYLTIADTYYSLEKFDKAIEYYKLAMKDKSLYWTAFYKQARSYAMVKNYTQARKMYFALLRRDKDNLNVRLSLAYLYAMEGKLDKAEVTYAFLWRDNKDNADTLVNYISVLIAQEKYQKANTYLDVLKERFSDNSNIATFDTKLKDYLPKPEVKLDEEEKDNVLPDEEAPKKAAE